MSQNTLPSDEEKGKREPPTRITPTPTVSTVLEDGSLVELLHDPSRRTTSLVVGGGDSWTIRQQLPDRGILRVPYSARNELLVNGVIQFPRWPAEYGDEADLVDAIAAYIHKYVDVSPRFERFASYYVLFSWVFDAFNELPYLRLRGDYGSGKTRFLITVGSICYKPIFASAASSVSPLFRLLNVFRGTLVVDEGDLRFSDEKADLVKILNNGNVRGVPVLRSERSASGEFNPRAFQVFGPKLVATRGYYDDRALESRFITEETGRSRLRPDVPINLPPDYATEAQELRNKLLLYRLRRRPEAKPDGSLVDPKIEPRLNQIAVPLLSIISRDDVRRELRELLREYNEDLIAARGMDVEAEILEAIATCVVGGAKAAVPIRDISTAFIRRSGHDTQAQVTNKWIGNIVRRRLQLKTKKSNGIYVIPFSEFPKLEVLFDRYGIDPGSLGVAGTSGT